MRIYFRKGKKKLYRGKIFGLGFHKTGTTSLHIFLKLLGYDGVHWPNKLNGIHYQKLCVPQLHDRRKVVDILLPVFEQFDTFTDVPVPALYEELDYRFPGSRFILIERDPDEWWESIAIHWRLRQNISRKLDPYEYLQYNYGETRAAISVITSRDRQELIRRYRLHNKWVRRYFRDRPGTLLTVSMINPEKARIIAEFLESKDYPDFPAIKRTSRYGPPVID